MPHIDFFCKPVSFTQEVDAWRGILVQTKPRLDTKNQPTWSAQDDAKHQPTKFAQEVDAPHRLLVQTCT